MKLQIAVSAMGLAALVLTGCATVMNAGFNEIDDQDVYSAEISNDTGADNLDHEVVVAFYDEDGEVVETQQVDTCLRSLQDGATNFFAAEAESDSSDTESAVAWLATDSSLELGTVEDGDIDVSDVTAQRDEDDDKLLVSGTVSNQDDDELEDAVVCAVVYDEDGDVLTIAKSGELDDLDEGESATFEFEIEVLDSTDRVDTVDIWVDGLEGGTPVEPTSEKDVNVEVIEATETPTSTPTETATATEMATPTETP